MFHYNAPTKFYPTQSSLGPRDKYLAALAMAKEAEKEYLSAEAAVEYEELALRRRLEELELQKRQLRGVERYSYGYFDRLFPLRHQLEEEERLKAQEEQTLARAALALKIGQEDLVRRQRHQQVQEAATRDFFAMRRSPSEQRELIALEERRKALEAQRTRRRAQQARNVAFIRQSRPKYPLVGPDTIFLDEPKGRYAVSRSVHCPHTCLQRSLSFGDYANIVAALAAEDEAPKRRPCVGKIQVKSDDAKKPLSSVASGQAKPASSSHANNIDEAPAPNGIVELLKAFLDDEVEVKASLVAHPSSVPSTSNPTEIGPKSKGSEVKSQQSSHITVEECLGAMLGHFAQRAEAPASREDATTSRSQPVEKKASSIESSLKAELEARLNNDQSNEIKDTIHAIFASLNHENVPSSSSIKGKEKAHLISTEHATSKDVVSSMEAVRNVEAAFHTLESEFVFPVQLDFTPAPSPTSSDSESSLIGRLAYTSRNVPVRYYEQSLSGLLAQLDSVESFGNEALRSVRKEVVGKVESALQELEREVEGRWRSKTAKESKVAEKQGADNAQAAEKVTSEFASEGAAPAEAVKDDEPVVVDGPAFAEAVAIHEDAAIAADTTLPNIAIVISRPEPIELLVSDLDSESSADKSSTIKDKELDTEQPLQASVYPPAYPPSSSSIDTVRPYDVESQSSEDPGESFLLSEENSADQETATKKKVDDDTGSDWSELEA